MGMNGKGVKRAGDAQTKKKGTNEETTSDDIYRYKRRRIVLSITTDVKINCGMLTNDVVLFHFSARTRRCHTSRLCTTNAFFPHRRLRIEKSTTSCLAVLSLLLKIKRAGGCA